MIEQREWLLRLASERATLRPEYLGWVFDQYCEQERVTREHLAVEFGCGRDSIVQAGLCLRPRANRFVADVSDIAERFGMDAKSLAHVVRFVDAIEAMRAGSAADRGALLAARIRAPKERKREEESED